MYSQMQRCVGHGSGEAEGHRPCSLWAFHPPWTSLCSATWKPSQTHTLRVFMQASPSSHDQVLSPSSLPLFFLDNGEGMKVSIF